MKRRRIFAVTFATLCAAALAATGAAPAARAGHLASKTVSYTHKGTGMTLTISKPELDPNGDSVNHPSRGMMFQLMYAQIRNGGSRARAFNPLDVVVVDNRKHSFKATFYLPLHYKPQLFLVTVPSHALRAGWIGFQIPRKTKYMDVTWNDQFSIDPPARVVRIHVG